MNSDITKDTSSAESESIAKSAPKVAAKSVTKTVTKSDSKTVTKSAAAKPIAAKKPLAQPKVKKIDAKDAADIISVGTAASEAAVKTLRMHDKDVGSSQVQIAKLTARISHLTDHLRIHKKDNHTRRGLIALISTRRKLTAYLKRVNLPAYRQVLSTLGLRK